MSLLQSCDTFADLAAVLSIDEAKLRAFAYKLPDSKKYKPRFFSKRDGSIRTLFAPHSTLKMIQRKLADELTGLYRPNSRAFAYIKERGIRANAAAHLRHRAIFCIDLVDFFGQINFGRIRGRLMAEPYNLTNSVATAIARLTTHSNQLPFGAPSSPVLSNMICSAMDAQLTDLGRDHGCFYTRYADDIVFSTQKRRFPPQVARLLEVDGVTQVSPGQELEHIVVSNGFAINPGKTRLRGRAESQIICGVLVNERLNVRRELRREVRALLHAWGKFGPEKVQNLWTSKFGHPDDKSFERALRGKIEFLRHIRGENDDLVWKAAERFNELTTGSKINYDQPVDWRSHLHRSVCVIFAESADINQDGAVSRQGSGFVVRNGYVITNAHVACYPDGSPVEKLTADIGGLSLPGLELEIVAKSLDLDIAVLRAKDELTRAALANRALEIDFSASLETGATMTLAGYPNHQEGDTLHVALGHVTGSSKINHLAVTRVSTSVIYGNSGGPILDEKGHVIAVAVCGSGTNDAPYTIHNGAIPARTIRTFVESVISQ